MFSESLIGWGIIIALWFAGRVVEILKYILRHLVVVEIARTFVICQKLNDVSKILSRVFTVSFSKSSEMWFIICSFIGYGKITYGVIPIPQISTANNKKITIAIPKRLGVNSWEMNSVKKVSKLAKNLEHEDYDMFQFRILKRVSNYYVFQTTSQLIDNLKSETVILIS